MARESEYVHRENRKRTLISWGAALLLYLILLTGYWAWDHFLRKDISMNQGPVLIRLGEPEGIDEPQPVPPQETAEETPPEPEEPRAQPEPEPQETPVVEPEETPVLPAADKAEAAPEPAPTEKPAVKAAPPAPPEPIKGSDKGNNYELNSEGGEIGQNMWIPIAQYMPLPQIINPVITADNNLKNFLDSLESGLFTVEESRKKLLEYYAKQQLSLVLKEPVPLADRPDLWLILEESGYDMSNPEYKNLPNLRGSSITINFTVVPSGGTRANELKDLEVVRETPYKEINEAVLYAFQLSTYYKKTEENDSGESVKGRFTYRFY